MAKKTKAPTWIWVEGRAFDHRGVRHWYPLFNHRTESEANTTLKAIERGVIDRKANRYLDRFDDFRVMPERDQLADMAKATAKAESGKCPNCGKKPGKHRRGTWKGYPALRCSRCEHKWAIGPPKDVDTIRWTASYDLDRRSKGAESPSKAPAEGSGSQGAKKKGKKKQKGKGKRKRKG